MAELKPAFGTGYPEGVPHPVADRPIQTNRLFGIPEPKGIQRRVWEKPWHRQAAYMFASGKVTIKQVAEACDVCVASVRSLLKNGWFQETVNLLMKEMGGVSVLELFKAEQINSLVTLTELRDDPKQSGSVRRASAVDILDRAMGKPIQTVVTDNTVRSVDPAAEAEQLKAELQRKQEALAKAGVIEIDVELPQQA